MEGQSPLPLSLRPHRLFENKDVAITRLHQSPRRCCRRPRRRPHRPRRTRSLRNAAPGRASPFAAAAEETSTAVTGNGGRTSLVQRRRGGQERLLNDTEIPTARSCNRRAEFAHLCKSTALACSRAEYRLSNVTTARANLNTATKTIVRQQRRPA